MPSVFLMISIQKVNAVVKPSYLVLLVLLPFLLLNGCSKKSQEQLHKRLLASRTWILSSYGHRNDVKHNLTEGVYYHLNFYEYFNQYTFSTSCPARGTSGKYRIHNQEIVFILGCCTHHMQRCPDDDGSERYQQGNDFIRAVIYQPGSKYRIRENELRLTASDGKQLIFTGVAKWSMFEFF